MTGNAWMDLRVAVIAGMLVHVIGCNGATGPTGVGGPGDPGTHDQDPHSMADPHEDDLPRASSTCVPDTFAGSSTASSNVCADVTYDSAKRAPRQRLSPEHCDTTGALGRCVVVLSSDTACEVWTDWVFPSSAAAGRTVASARAWCESLTIDGVKANATWKSAAR